MGDELHTY